VYIDSKYSRGEKKMLSQAQENKINEFIDKYERLCKKNRGNAENIADEKTVNYLAGRADGYNDAAISLRTLLLLLKHND
jgi:hypothetical protein